jgi:hypothetical protein
MTEDDIAEGRSSRPSPYLANFLVTIGSGLSAGKDPLFQREPKAACGSGAATR